MERKVTRRQALVALCAAAAACGMAVPASALAAGASAPGDVASSSKDASAKGDVASREFTDSLGRTVELPAELTAIAPSGFVSQQVLMTLAPEKMAVLASALTDAQAHVFGEQYATLPEVGAIFGSKGGFNREAVAASGAQVVIDVGQAKKGMAEDLDALQDQLGIPCVHVDASLDAYDACYRTLGELLGVEGRAGAIADYCADAYEEVTGVLETIPEQERTGVLYLTGADGLSCMARGAFQSGVVDMVANNVAVVDDPSGKSNQTSLEQIASWDPAFIVFAPESAYDLVGTDETWKTLTAIEGGEYCEAPGDPFNWLSAPPSVNQVLGMQWFARVLYPGKFDDDMYETVAAYYKAMFQYDLSADEFAQVTARAVPPAQQ